MAVSGQEWLRSRGKAGARSAQGAEFMRCLWRSLVGAEECLVGAAGIVGTRDEGETFGAQLQGKTEVQFRHRVSVYG